MSGAKAIDKCVPLKIQAIYPARKYLTYNCTCLNALIITIANFEYYLRVPLIAQIGESNKILFCVKCGKFLFKNVSYGMNGQVVYRTNTCFDCLRPKYRAQVGEVVLDNSDQSSISQQEITIFDDDVNADNYEKPLITAPLRWTKMASDNHLHDVSAILRRSRIVGSGTFVNPPGTVFSLDFPSAMSINDSTAAAPNIMRKLDFFAFLRADLMLKIVFNATPFQSGRYWLYFAPFEKICNRPSKTYAANFTGYPGVELDIASNAPVSLHIPYCAPLSHYGLQEGTGTMGTFYIVPLVPLDQGTTPPDPVTFEVFAWFDNIELAVPSTTKALPTLTAQVGNEAPIRSSRKSDIEGVGGAAINLISKLPVVGAAVKPLSWVSHFLSRSFTNAGYCKPTSVEALSKFVHIPAKGLTTFDALDMSQKMAATSDNSIDSGSEYFSTAVDEMDISYIARKSCAFNENFAWSKDDASGIRLIQFPVSPGISSGSNVDIYPTTLAFLTSMFRYWRGDITFRLTAAKTAFHTGRLRITYNPDFYDDASTDQVSENAYNWILDLSQDSELTFTIPYVSNEVWKRAYPASYNDWLVWRRREFSTGIVTIEVLTPLRVANTAVSSTVGLGLWVNSDNISFSVPETNKFYISSSSDRTFTEFRAQIFNTASTAISHNEQKVPLTNFPFPNNSEPLDPEIMTIGEKVNSLRQIIKRFVPSSFGPSWPYPQLATPANMAYVGPLPLDQSTEGVGPGTTLIIDPAFLGSKQTGVTDPQTVDMPISRNAAGVVTSAPVISGRYIGPLAPVEYVSYMYRFYRGAKRYKVLKGVDYTVEAQTFGSFDPATPATPATTMFKGVVMTPDTQNYAIAARMTNAPSQNGSILVPAVNSTATAPPIPGSFVHVLATNTNQVLEFEVPYYSRMPISLVAEGTIAGPSLGPVIERKTVRVSYADRFGSGASTPFVNFDAVSPYPTTTQSSPRGFGAYGLYHAAGDDFSFGYLVGAPSLNRAYQP